MWVRTRPRNEHENAVLINLDLVSRVHVNQLAEKWFVEVMIAAESFPLATATSLEEAMSLLERLFTALEAGDHAVDLQAGRGNEAGHGNEARGNEARNNA